MKIFKCITYSFALLIGTSIAFCAHTDYDHNSGDYPPTKPAKSVVKKEPLSDQLQIGKKLFKVNCAACHNRNMIDDLTGPAISGTLERWEGREALLYQWIRNSSAVIASGDAYAVQLYQRYNKSAMTAFRNLKDAEIEALLAYIARND